VSIASDDVAHKVTVTQFELALKFQYVAVPTKIQKAYLKALSKNLSSFVLLRGLMNIFIDNFLISKTLLRKTNPKGKFFFPYSLTYNASR